MPTRNFTHGRVRRADHDSATQQLNLFFDNGSAIAYLQVPDEVFRRLCAAPNPGTYWEDRIAEEYPKGPTPAPAGAPSAEKKWSDLFGGDGD